MSDSADIVTAWDANPSQLWAVRLRAKCFSQQQIADIVGASLRTVQYWCAMPEFDAAVKATQADFIEDFEEQFERIIANAMRIEEMSQLGEIPADDPRAIQAHDTLSKVVFPLARRRAGNGALQPQADAPRELNPGRTA